jgi:ABC-type sulfate/molybdate transport systems ATPase subunit
VTFALDIEEACVGQNDEVVLGPLTLSVGAGECVAIVGPNRAGKTQLLRLCVGLVPASRGAVTVLGQSLVSLDADALDALRRRVGVVLTPPALLHNLTVFDNVALPVRYHNIMPEDALTERVQALLSTFRVSDIAKRFPAQLNEGEAARVAFARALVIEPDLLLLDDPTDGLDASGVERLAAWLTAFKRARRCAVVFALRSYNPVIESADRIVFLRDGRVQALGTRAEMLSRGIEDIEQYVSPKSNHAVTP